MKGIAINPVPLGDGLCADVALGTGATFRGTSFLCKDCLSLLRVRPCVASLNSAMILARPRITTSLFPVTDKAGRVATDFCVE